MRVEGSSGTELLAELKLLLESDQLPVQQEVARAVGVHQSLVSRAQNGQLRRITRKVNALLDYARSRAGIEVAERAAAKALEIAATIPSPEPETARKDEPRPSSDASADAFSRQARDSIETYLSDGYDPRLVVEQLAVLRRAQRLRRSGKRRSAAVQGSASG
jgi:predicted XRE-type DNA-binding protein